MRVTSPRGPMPRRTCFLPILLDASSIENRSSNEDALNAPLEISWSPSPSMERMVSASGVLSKSWKDLIFLWGIFTSLSPTSTRPPKEAGTTEGSFPQRVTRDSSPTPSGIRSNTSRRISCMDASFLSGTGDPYVVQTLIYFSVMDSSMDMPKCLPPLPSLARRMSPGSTLVTGLDPSLVTTLMVSAFWSMTE